MSKAKRTAADKLGQLTARADAISDELIELSRRIRSEVDESTDLAHMLGVSNSQRICEQLRQARVLIDTAAAALGGARLRGAMAEVDRRAKAGA